MMERNFSCLLDSGKYHTDNPEENNIVSCYKYVCRIEVFHLLCFFRPAKSRERPECGAEPCIKRILVLMKMCAAAFRTFLRHFCSNHNLAALIAVICRDSVSPPELSGNTPVADIFKPVQICLVKTLRNESELFVIQSFDGSLCHLVHFYKPLWLDHRLYGCSAAVVCSYVMGMWNNLYKKSQLF